MHRRRNGGIARRPRQRLVEVIVACWLVGSCVGVVSGNGSPANGTCYASLQGVPLTGLVQDVPLSTCTDGDPCDGDGVANGACQFTLFVCAYDTNVPACVPSTVVAMKAWEVRRGMRVRSRIRLPQLPITAPTCSDPSDVILKLRGGRSVVRRRLILRTRIQIGFPKTDRDRLVLECTRVKRSSAAGPATV